MPKTIHSAWHYNGGDVLFSDDAFHALAYKITYTYQKFMAKMEREHGERRARHEAWIRGWKHQHEADISSVGQRFELPGYVLYVGTKFDSMGLRTEATITLLFE